MSCEELRKAGWRLADLLEKAAVRGANLTRKTRRADFGSKSRRNLFRRD
jgi:hypothetical protein